MARVIESASSKKRSGVTPVASVSPPKKARTSKFNVTAKKVKVSVSIREKILSAAAELYHLGVKAPPRIQVVMFANYKHLKSTGVANELTRLKFDGLIEYPNKDTLSLTEAGLAAAPEVVPPQSLAEVHDRMKSLLEPKARELFTALEDGKAHTRSEMMKGCGYKHEKSTGWQKCLSQLRALDLADYTDGPDGTKGIRLTSIAFPDKFMKDAKPAAKNPPETQADDVDMEVANEEPEEPEPREEPEPDEREDPSGSEYEDDDDEDEDDDDDDDLSAYLTDE